MSQLGIGIVGTGMIAGVIADAIAKSKNARLTAVSSRRIENAQSFVDKRQGALAVQGIGSLLTRTDVGAVYVAIPTAAKEETALFQASLKRLGAAFTENFMSAASPGIVACTMLLSPNNPAYKTDADQGPVVTSLCGIPAPKGSAWTLYVDGKPYKGSLGRVTLVNDTLVEWQVEKAEKAP